MDSIGNSLMPTHSFENAWLSELDELCDRFEAAWKAGLPQPIEQFAADLEPDRRLAVARELIQLEIEYRQKAGQSPTPDDYSQRFPELKTEIDSLFLEPTVIAADRRVLLASLPQPTQRIGDFEIIERLKAGGMGVIYKAQQVKLKRLVALKLIRSGELASAIEIERFKNEAEAAAKLEHLGIVPIFDHGTVGDQHYIAMAFINGPSLAERVAQSPLPAREAAELVRRLAIAVDYAHRQGVIHRDLKPGNILLAPLDGSQSPGRGIWEDSGASPASSNPLRLAYEPKITDFGLAKLIDRDHDLTKTGEILGTLEYMPPEQASGRMSEVAEEADIYSLGAILYRLLTGRPPFQAASQVELIRQLTQDEPVRLRVLSVRLHRDLETVCLKCLEKNPERRFATAAELAEELGRFLTGAPIRSRRITRLEQAWRWCKRKPLVAAVMLLVAFIAVAGPLVALRLRSSLRLAETRLAESYFDRGVALCENGDANAGMHWLSRALDVVPHESRHLERAIRGNLTSWSRQVHRLQGLIDVGESGGSVVAFSPDGARILIGQGNGIVRVWDTATLKPIGTPLQQHRPGIRTAAFSNDGTRALTGSDDGTAVLWDLTKHQVIGAPLEHQGSVRAVRFSPDDSLFVTSDDRSAQIWDATTRERLHILAHDGIVASAAFHPKGSRILTGSYDRTAKLWDTISGKMIRSIPHRSMVEVVAFSPDGTRLVTGGWMKSVQLWDANTLEPSDRSIKPIGEPVQHQASISSVSFSVSGNYLVTGSSDGTARLWNAKSGNLIGGPVQHGSEVLSVAISPDGAHVLTGGRDRYVRLWKLSLDEPLVTVTHQAQVYSASFSPDGSRFLTASEDGTAQIWDAVTGMAVGSPMRHDHPVHTAMFRPDGKAVLTRGNDKPWQTWDVLTGRSLGTLFHNDNRIRAAKFSPDGSRLLTANWTELVRLWDARTGNELLTIRDQRPMVPISFSPDGRKIVTSSIDNTVRLWNPDTGATIGQPLQHPTEVTALSFSPDGKLIVTGCRDGSVQLWSEGRQVLIGQVRHRGVVLDLAGR